MRWSGHVARMGERKMHIKVKGRENVEDIGVKGRIILERTFG
jgi:hypothetical protein